MQWPRKTKYCGINLSYTRNMQTTINPSCSYEVFDKTEVFGTSLPKLKYKPKYSEILKNLYSLYWMLRSKNTI